MRSARPWATDFQIFAYRINTGRPSTCTRLAQDGKRSSSFTEVRASDRTVRCSSSSCRKSRLNSIKNNIALFAISYDSVEVLAAFAEKHGITYPLLSDEWSKVIRELGLLNEHVFEQHSANGVRRNEAHYGVPYPGTFVLDERGIVVDKRFFQSYRERETGVGVLENALRITSPEHGSDRVASVQSVQV